MKPFLASLRAAVALHKKLEASASSGGDDTSPVGGGGATGGSDADCEGSPTVSGKRGIGDVESANLSPSYSNSSLATPSTSLSLSRQASR